MANEKDNRVLSRTMARIITPEEAQAVNGNGAFPPHTNTACSFALAGGADGDIGEC
jgi:hypothetical protein